MIAGPRRELLHHLVQLMGRLRHADVHDRGEDLAHAVGELDRAEQMVRDVPQVRDELRRHEVGVIGEPVDQLARRHRMPAESNRVSPEPEDLDLQGGSRRGLRLGPEDHALELVRAVLELLDHLEILVHDLVRDRVQGRPGPGGERADDRPPLLRLRRDRTPGAKRSVTRNRGEANTKSSDPATPSAPRREDGTPRRRAPDRGPAWVAGSAGRRPRRRGRADPAAAGAPRPRLGPDRRRRSRPRTPRRDPPPCSGDRSMGTPSAWMTPSRIDVCVHRRSVTGAASS